MISRCGATLHSTTKETPIQTHLYMALSSDPNQEMEAELESHTTHPFQDIENISKELDLIPRSDQMLHHSRKCHDKANCSCEV